jgi:hypothetical protein
MLVAPLFFGKLPPPFSESSSCLLDAHELAQARLRRRIAAHGVSIGAQGEARIGVSELVHDAPGIDADAHEDRRERMPELVRGEATQTRSPDPDLVENPVAKTNTLLQGRLLDGANRARTR